MFIYFWESMSGGGVETEGDTESEEGCRLWAVSTEFYAGFKFINHEITTWAKVLYLNDWATPVPLYIKFQNLCVIPIYHLKKNLWA